MYMQPPHSAVSHPHCPDEMHRQYEREGKANQDPLWSFVLAPRNRHGEADIEASVQPIARIREKTFATAGAQMIAHCRLNEMTPLHQPVLEVSLFLVPRLREGNPARK